METRKQRMVRYVSDSRAEMQLQPLDPRVLERTVEQWMERIRWIQDEHLDECYQVAMDNHSVRTPLMPKELIDAWTLIRQRPGFSARQQKRERLCQWGCSADGWITVDAGGDALIAMSTDASYQIRKEYLYIKPCPEHRSTGIPGADHAAPHCSGDWPRVRTRPGAEKPPTEARGVVAGWQSLGAVVTKLNLPEPPVEAPPRDDEEYLGW